MAEADQPDLVRRGRHRGLRLEALQPRQPLRVPRHLLLLPPWDPDQELIPVPVVHHGPRHHRQRRRDHRRRAGSHVHLARVRWVRYQ